MTLYKLDRGEITEAGPQTTVDGCNSILVYAENELHAGWVGLLFDADKIILGAGDVVCDENYIPTIARLPDYLDTKLVSIMLHLRRRQVQHYCQKLGFKKMGRDYQLTVNQVEELYYYRLSNPVGRPRKRR